MLAYYFGERRYQKAAVSVYGFNDASLALHRRLGFRIEGRARRAVFTAGAYHDQVWFGLTAEEFTRRRDARGQGSVRGGAESVQYRLRPELDLAELARLRDAAWDGPTSGDFGAVLEHSFTWVGAFDAGALVGFVNVAWDGGAHFFLLDTTVHPDWQHLGVGTELARRAVEACRGRDGWIHVDAGADLADFYRSVGFADAEWTGLAPLGGQP